MKVLLYSEGMKYIGKSGLGRAIEHQKKALTLEGISFTTDYRDDFDLMHINTYFGQSYRLLHKVKKQGKPIVYHAHSTKEDFQNSFIFSNAAAPLFSKWILHCYSHGDVVLTPTPYSKQLLQQAGLEQPIIPISNGIDLSFYKATAEMEASFRQKYGYKETDKVIRSVGLYIKRKGILDFVALAKAMPAYQFIWFGYLNLHQVPHEIREAVETKLPNLQFAGYVAPDELRNAYCGADLFFFPTYEETEGIVLLEALAMGQEILIRDIPIYEGDLVDGKHVYKGKTNDDFQRLINGILEGDLPSLKAAGQERIRQKDLRCIGSELRSAYETAIQLHKSDGGGMSVPGTK